MSTKSTIILTDDKNEHIFFDCSEYVEVKGRDYTGNEIVFDFDKSNIEIYSAPEDDFISFGLKTDSEMYRFFETLFNSLYEIRTKLNKDI